MHKFDLFLKIGNIRPLYVSFAEITTIITETKRVKHKDGSSSDYTNYIIHTVSGDKPYKVIAGEWDIVTALQMVDEMKQAHTRQLTAQLRRKIDTHNMGTKLHEEEE